MDKLKRKYKIPRMDCKSCYRIMRMRTNVKKHPTSSRTTARRISNLLPMYSKTEPTSSFHLNEFKAVCGDNANVLNCSIRRAIPFHYEFAGLRKHYPYLSNSYDSTVWVNVRLSYLFRMCSSC